MVTCVPRCHSAALCLFHKGQMVDAHPLVTHPPILTSRIIEVVRKILRVSFIRNTKCLYSYEYSVMRCLMYPCQ